MTVLAEKNTKPAHTGSEEGFRVTLKDGKQTTVYVVRYKTGDVRPKVMVFDEAVYLLEWCKQNKVKGAITGSYFLRKEKKLVGEVWSGGKAQDHVPIPDIWGLIRGSVSIDTSGNMKLGRRHSLPKKPKGDLLQAGPLLVRAGKSIVSSKEDPEGFSSTPELHDPNSIPTEGRFPRAAIGLNEDYIWTVACDSRNAKEAGLTVEELADIFVALGATEALNLDGGSSASLISDGRLLNKPHSVDEGYWPKGRPVHTAIVFESI